MLEKQLDNVYLEKFKFTKITWNKNYRNEVVWMQNSLGTPECCRDIKASLFNTYVITFWKHKMIRSCSCAFHKLGWAQSAGTIVTIEQRSCEFVMSLGTHLVVFCRCYVTEKHNKSLWSNCNSGKEFVFDNYKFRTLVLILTNHATPKYLTVIKFAITGNEIIMCVYVH